MKPFDRPLLFLFVYAALCFVALRADAPPADDDPIRVVLVMPAGDVRTLEAALAHGRPIPVRVTQYLRRRLLVALDHAR